MIFNLIVDRFEDKYAILEIQEKNPLIFNFPRHLLPQNAKEDSAIRFNIDIDKKDTTRRRNKIIEKVNGLMKF